MLIEMQVTGLTMDPMTEMPIIILKDMAGENPLPIWIGVVEASAIATMLERIELSRPTTHDLMRNVLCQLGAKVQHIEITDLRDNTYYGTIVIKHGEKVHHIDARPSDAVALALRAGCPIRVEERVIKMAREIDLRQRDAIQAAQSADTAREYLASLPDDQFGKWKM